MDIFTKKITILKTLIDKTIKEGEIFGERFTTMEKKFRHFQSRDEINGQFHQMKTSLVSLVYIYICIYILLIIVCRQIKTY